MKTMEFQPRAFIARLAALMPPPTFPMLRHLAVARCLPRAPPAGCPTGATPRGTGAAHVAGAAWNLAAETNRTSYLHLPASALAAANRAILPCDFRALVLDNVDALFDTVEAIQVLMTPTLAVLGPARTRVDRRNLTMNAAIEATLSTRYAGHVLESIIGISSSVPKAQLEGRSVLTSDPKSRGAEDHAALAAEVLTRLQ